MNVLVLNAGSSSLKFEVIATELKRIQQNRGERLYRGVIERIGSEAIITVQNRSGQAKIDRCTAEYPRSGGIYH